MAARSEVRLEGVHSHLARADESDLEPSFEQLRRFRAVLEGRRKAGVSPGLVHAASSAGLLAEPLPGGARHAHRDASARLRRRRSDRELESRRGVDPRTPSVEEAAGAADTIPYELLVRVGERVRRRVIGRETGNAV